jgi:hypothetical protein
MVAAVVLSLTIGGALLGGSGAFILGGSRPHRLNRGNIVGLANLIAGTACYAIGMCMLAR